MNVVLDWVDKEVFLEKSFFLFFLFLLYLHEMMDAH